MPIKPAPVLDIQAYKGITFSVAFRGRLLDDSGQPTGEYYDLTGKTLRATINGIFPSPLLLDSSQDYTAGGTAVLVDDDPTTGKFNFVIGAVDLSNVHSLIGYYHIDGGPDGPLFVRGTIKVDPMNAGGTL